MNASGQGVAPAAIPAPEPARASSVGLAWIWLFWSNRRLLATITAIGVALSLIIALLLPKEYESTVRLMPPDSKSNPAASLIAGLAGQSIGLGVGDLLGMKSSGAVFVSILRSRTLQDRLVNRFELRSVYRTRYQDQARKELEKRTSISEEAKSGVITLAVLDRSPERAAAIANAYTEELDRLSAEMTTSAAHRERVFIEERLKLVKADLDEAAKQFSQFSSKTGAIDVKEQGKAIVGAAAQVRAEVAAAESELRGLQQIYTDSNIRVKSLKARIAELRKELQKAEGANVTAATDTDPARDSLGTSLQKLPLLSVPYADLYRQTQVQAAVYEVLTKQYELAKVQEAKEIPTVRVLDQGDVPERKARPKRALIVLIGTLLSMVVGFAWIAGRAYWDALDETDERRQLIREVLADGRRHLNWIRLHRRAQVRLRRNSDESAG